MANNTQAATAKEEGSHSEDKGDEDINSDVDTKVETTCSATTAGSTRRI